MAYRKPSQTELAQYFGIHRNSIKKYLKEFVVSQYYPSFSLANLPDLIFFIQWMKSSKGRVWVAGEQTKD